MGERKVLNKYYPPDFNPAEIPRKKGARKEQIKVRMMLPMSIQCNTCGNFIYKGAFRTKFNSRLENAAGEDYLGIQVVRLYIKCPRCSAEIALKTDPKNSDYILEAGATRNYEPWRETETQLDKARAQREAEEEGNAMKALENKTMDSKREIDILNALDEIRAVNAKHAKLTPDEILAAIRKKGEEDTATFGAATEEDLEAAAAAEFQRQTAALGGFVRRLESSSDEEGEGGRGAAKRPKRDPLAVDPLGGTGAGPGTSAGAGAGVGAGAGPSSGDGAGAAKAAGRPAAFAWSAPQRKPVVLVKKKDAAAPAAAPPAAAAAAAGAGAEGAGGGGLAGLLGGYASSDSNS